MIIKSIWIKEGLYYRDVSFSNHANLIFSKGENSTGKTTLMRLILYAMGYPVPSTKGIDFDALDTRLTVANQGVDFTIIRTNDYLTLAQGTNNKITFILPEDFPKLLEIIFDNKNTDILDNLLGVCYIDQDRGWTLLNRGKVVGNIRFNIERLIRGLSNRSCTDLENQLAHVNDEIQKYTQMLKVGEYQEQYLEKESFLQPLSSDDRLDRELLGLRIEHKQLGREVHRIRQVLRDNGIFKKYIEDMRLSVLDGNGNEIPVTAETIIGFGDAQEVQIVKCKMAEREMSKLTARITALETQKEEQGFANGRTVIDEFDHQISSVPINMTQVAKILKGLRNQKKQLEDTIADQTKLNNEVADDLNKLIYSYAKELGVERYVAANGVFTNQLKSLSGAIYHKLVFAFRLAYLTAVEKYARLNLPIMIDSPTGREVNQENVDKSMQILKRDFSHHQIIIASIYTYDVFADAKVVTIESRLIDQLKAN